MDTQAFITRVDALVAKAEQVLATHRQPPPGHLTSNTLDAGAFSEWQTQSLWFLTSVLGAEHVYSARFAAEVTMRSGSDVRTGTGILRAVREDLAAGYLMRVESLVAAEVFSGFAEMAAHLLEAGYKDPAASLVGAVLENGLGRIAAGAGITVRSRDDLSSFNQKCADAGIYTRLVQKKIQVWTDIRNYADHGQFDAYAVSDVQEMLHGVTAFLADHPA